MTVDWTKPFCFIWFRHGPRGFSGVCCKRCYAQSLVAKTDGIDSEDYEALLDCTQQEAIMNRCICRTLRQIVQQPYAGACQGCFAASGYTLLLTLVLNTARTS